jgi:hypothetical protein
MIDANDSGDDATDRRANTHHVHYDPATEATIGETLVTAVADLTDVDPLEMTPLYESVDPETLDEFVGGDELPDVSGTLDFTFESYEVTVHATGLLKLRPAE